MNKLLTKTVQWSYPTSPNAERFGFPKGCYTLELTDPAGIIPPQPLKGFATEPEAMAAAHKLPQPWDRLFLKFEHPEFASTSQGDEEERRHMLREDQREHPEPGDEKTVGHLPDRPEWREYDAKQSAGLTFDGESSFEEERR